MHIIWEAIKLNNSYVFASQMAQSVNKVLKSFLLKNIFSSFFKKYIGIFNYCFLQFL